MIQAVFEESRRWRAEEWKLLDTPKVRIRLGCKQVHRFLRLPLTLSIPLRNLQVTNRS